jgi:hypothetical protein
MKVRFLTRREEIFMTVVEDRRRGTRGAGA